MAGTESESGFTFVDRRRRGGEPPGEAPRPSAVPSPPPPSPSSPLLVDPGGGPPGAPRADLGALCVMLYSDALVNLGQAPNPAAGGRPRVDLEQARFAIDLLAMLQEKTHGNRTPEESDVLEEMLAALRMAYVQLTRRP